jgi:two-component system sensor histidine kinase PilS (NtrC family)
MSSLPAQILGADWRLIQVYSYYRLFLAVLLLVIYTLKPDEPMIGTANPTLFLITTIGYVAAATSTIIFLRWQRSQIPGQSLMLLMIDIIALTLMVHASGGISTQLTLLFMVAIAAGNILLSGRMGAFIAATAVIAILFEQFYFILTQQKDLTSDALAQSSILGLSFFAVALFSQLIAHRSRHGEALAEQRAGDIKALQRLNDQIIRRMRTGILVINRNRHILLSNDATRELLGTDAPIETGTALADLSLTLETNFHAWRRNPLLRPVPFRNTQESTEISARFARLNPEDPQSGIILIFIEDTTQITQRAQQLKLASLGRLTASIAHEIRNPLGAISHAAQLLAESEHIDGGDKRLLDIIEQHSKRMNGIVENVLSVSRRLPSYPEVLDLPEWLHRFRTDYLDSSAAQSRIELELNTDSIEVRFDTQQLYQVVSNLVMNGLRYSTKHDNIPHVRLVAGLQDSNQLPYLEVIDDGPGVPAALREHLFEPFYTTEATGTGLGLYLSREICEANLARLDYVAGNPGSCFRIIFAHPDRLH